MAKLRYEYWMIDEGGTKFLIYNLNLTSREERSPIYVATQISENGELGTFSKVYFPPFGGFSGYSQFYEREAIEQYTIKSSPFAWREDINRDNPILKLPVHYHEMDEKISGVTPLHFEGEVKSGKVFEALLTDIKANHEKELGFENS